MKNSRDSNEIFIHRTAEVQSSSIGKGTSIWQNCIVLQNARIGLNCNINAFCFIENDVVIGNNVTLKCGIYVWDGIRIEDDVFVGANVMFTNDNKPRSKAYQQIPQKTIIKKGASIGTNSTILPGLCIGEFAMIGAGSIVTKNVPPHTLWLGHPAQFRGYVCECGCNLDNNYVCSECRVQYSFLCDNILKKYE